jgi:hypothetical protein
MCAIGCDVTETASHLFLWCDNSFTLWSLVAAWLGLSLAYSNDLRRHYIQFCSMAGFPWIYSYLVCLCLGDMERQKQTYFPKRGITCYQSFGENRTQFFFVDESKVHLF